MRVDDYFCERLARVLNWKCQGEKWRVSFFDETGGCYDPVICLKTLIRVDLTGVWEGEDARIAEYVRRLFREENPFPIKEKPAKIIEIREKRLPKFTSSLSMRRKKR